MKFVKKITKLFLTLVMFSNLIAIPVAVAQTDIPLPTLLPIEDQDFGGRRGECIGLATMVRTGNIGLRNIPCFLKFFAQTLIAIAGSLSVVFVMIGGYTYVMGRDEDKDKAKRTITYALIGLAISLLAFIITDIALQIATE